MTRRLTERELIERLRGAGYSAREIGATLGRNNRMVYRVAKGERAAPEGWRESLARMWGTVRRSKDRPTVEQLRGKVPEPVRRVAKSGQAQRLRKGVWSTGENWATGLVQGQAARNGAHALVAGVEAAVSRMWRLAVTVTFRERRAGGGAGKGAKWYPPKHDPPRRSAAQKKMKLWYATSRMTPVDLLRAYGDAGSTSLTVAILEYLKAEEIVSFDSVEAAIGDIEQIEMRIWTE